MSKVQLKSADESNYISTTMKESFCLYSERLQQLLSTMDWHCVELLCQKLVDCMAKEKQVFICGNGGSAGNAIHLANDLIYGAGGIKAEALSANSAVLTCLANDVSYDSIFSLQLRVKANKDDVLIVLSGSGNSKNIVQAVETAKSMEMITVGVLGYDGGECKNSVDIAIHTAIDDMQISEDMQLVVGHMVMQWLSTHSLQIKSRLNG